MKVLFVAREYPPFEVGGAAVHTFNLVKNLKKIGVSCKVISFGDPRYSNHEVVFVPPSSSIISKSNCSMNMDLKIPLDIVRITRIANYLIKTEGFDVVHVQEPYVGAFVRHRRKVTTVHDTSYGDIKSLLRSNKNFPNIKRVAFYFSLGFFLELMCTTSSTVVITPSKQIRQELLEIYQIPKNKVVVLRSGVNLPELLEFDSKKKAKKKLGLSSDKLLIFTTSQHIPRKRLDTLLNAVSLLREQNVAEYNIVITGDGPFRPVLINLAKKLGLEGIVEFPGWVSREKLELYYQAADIFVLTSEYEAGPISLLEAMSFGNAVVSSRIDGVPGLMLNNVDGLLFPVGNSALLSKRLGLLLNDDSLRMRLSASARHFAEKFDWKVVAEETKNVYRSLL
jgi:glycosyltransferase involved in cell wall biosynthesis